MAPSPPFSLILKSLIAGFDRLLPCFWDEIDPMDTRDLKIELLTILAVGCKKRPAYRALRPANVQIP
jgi:hypothetical protein